MSLSFSIAMPVLNGDVYIERAINSVLGQLYTNFELIIVDGGSTDNTLDIIANFIAGDARITLMNSPKSGIYEAIFTAFETANGQVYSWLNADNIYMPWALSSVVGKMERDGAEWVTGLPSILDADGNMRCIYPHTPMPQWLIKRGACHFQGLGCIQAESTFFSANLFNNLTGEQGKSVTSQKLAGDFLLWRYFAAYERLHQIPTVLGGFRIHGENKSIVGYQAYMEEVIASNALHLPYRAANILRRILAYSFASRLQRRSEVENSLLSEAIDTH